MHLVEAHGRVTKGTGRAPGLGSLCSGAWLGFTLISSGCSQPLAQALPRLGAEASLWGAQGWDGGVDCDEILPSSGSLSYRSILTAVCPV